MDRFYIITFGCQMNKYDSQLVREKLKNIGLKTADSPEEAEVIFLNTCTVRERAERKIIDTIRMLKRSNKEVFIIGCLAQVKKDRLLRSGADVVIGPRNYTQLERIWREYREGGERVFCEDRGFLEFDELPVKREIMPAEVSAFINIIQGCDKVCSFCIVPKTRGREVSRPCGDILKEALYLESKGIKEVCLLGQNVDSYHYAGIDFSDLLCLLDNNTSLYRIRFTTSHPADMSYKVIKTVKNSARITDWFHLPLQAGSTKVLRDMGRGYTKEEYIDIVRTIRNTLPEAVVTTDIMVGYPGEEEEDFLETLDVVRICEFDGAYTFMYSPRSGTPAALKETQVDEAEKGRRLRRLIEVTNETAYNRRRNMVGKVYEIMIEGPSRKNGDFSSGRTRGNIKGVVEGVYPPGSILRVKVERIKGLTPIMKLLERVV